MSHLIEPASGPDPASNEDPAITIAAVKEAINVALSEAHNPGIEKNIEIIAISKKHSVDTIERALAAGHRSFGENRVQEAMSKWVDLKKKYPDITLHLVGPLQSNKAKEAVALFDVIHTIDRIKIAKAVGAEAEAQGRSVRTLIQVNTGEEPQKSGIAPGEIESFIKDCNENTPLTPSGLMCIPPIGEPPAPHFALLAKLARRHELRELSMGMSSDFETAAQLGATMVRVGTTIFGKRPEKVEF